MTLYRKALAAWTAAIIFILSLSALGEAARYDMNAPQNLLPEHLCAESALLIDGDTGETLFSKNARVRMYPASTTKIMTLLLGLESGIALDEPITIPAEAADIPEGSSVIPVKPGDVMSYGDLLYSFMLSSGNDGANAVAVLADGSIEAFVQRMNDRAAALGMEGTHYVNAHGYHVGDHYTTAQDLATLARAAMENETFRHIVAQPSWTITVTRGGETKTAEIVSRNSLLQSDQKYYYPDCTGIKTGHHNKAGWCFVGSAERDGMRLICVVLKCAQENDKWYDAAKLFEYGFTRYEDVTARTLLERAFDGYARVEIENAADGEGTLPLSLSGVTGGERTLKVVRDSDAALASAVARAAEGLEISWTRPLEAPVRAGEVVGSLSCAMPGGETVTAELIAARDVAARATAAPVVTAAPAPVQTDAPNEPQPARGRGGNALPALLILLALLAVCCAAAAHIVRRNRRRRAAARRRARARQRRGNPKR